MRLMYSEELQPYINKSKDEIMEYAVGLINSDNAINWQKVGELVHLLRRSHLKAEGVEVAKKMYEKSPTIDKLNQLFVAVVDRGDIAEIRAMDQMVDEYLEKNDMGYQKHLFATWLKGANTIMDDQMFETVYNRVPSAEKVENTYIISQYYVFLNRHSRYAEVRDHYHKLPENIKNSTFVKRYYENASSRMGFVVNRGYVPRQVNSVPVTVPTPVIPVEIGGFQGDSQNDSPADFATASGEKKLFIVYGNNPGALVILKALLDSSKIPYATFEGKIGDTVIATFERMANEAALALVLCTPEDEMADGSWNPRQNVIFELGYFRAKLGANKTCILRQTQGKKLNMPSDLNGVLDIDMDNSAAFVTKLSAVLREAGFTPSF